MFLPYIPRKHVREFFHVFPSKYLEKSDFLPIFANESIKVIVMEKRNLTRKEALERLQKSIKAKKDYIKETRVALENEYIQRFGVKPSNHNVW